MNLLNVIACAVVFVALYFIMSIIASHVLEYISGILSTRSKNLRDRLAALLTGDGAGNDRVKAHVSDILDHSLIGGLKAKGMPSYVPSANVALAVVDVLTAGSNAPTVTALQKAAVDLPDCGLKDLTTSLLRASGGDLDAFKTSLAKWFDDAMEQVGGEYTRRSRWWLLLIGLVLAIGLNVDCITVIRGFGGMTISDATIKQISILTQDGKPLDDATRQKAEDLLFSLHLPIGWMVCKDEKADCPGSVTDYVTHVRHDYTILLWSMVGWLLSGFLVSLGSPFWFDLLGEVVNLRAAADKARTLGTAGIT